MGWFEAAGTPQIVSTHRLWMDRWVEYMDTVRRRHRTTSTTGTTRGTTSTDEDQQYCNSPTLLYIQLYSTPPFGGPQRLEYRDTV
jgi:hypothetical protein